MHIYTTDMKKHGFAALLFLLFSTNGFALIGETLSGLPQSRIIYRPQLIYSNGSSVFNVWSPDAGAVLLSLYRDGESSTAFKTIKMRKDPDGYWSATIKKDLAGTFYTFTVKHNNKWLDPTPGIDAKAVGVNGNRAFVIDLKKTNPEDWLKDIKPTLNKFTDIIIYELQHRDFSIYSGSGIKNKGKYLALTEKNTVNNQGFSTGIDHLKELGITHVHIMPSYDFGSIDETRLFENKYNWGYDPKNYNVPEGSFSTNPYDPASRIKEFKQMVKSLHENGIRVILDVVYNHTYVNDKSNFSLTAPGYYYRYNNDATYSDASACGNETASEKEMMRNFMVESVKYWVNEYHIDGFRFDLMGIHDIETMNIIRSELDKIDSSIIIYGEGWTAGSSPLAEEKRAIKKNGKMLPRIAVFSDDLRDAAKGHWNDHKAPGMVGAKTGLEESIRFGVCGAVMHDQVDFKKVNYSDAPYANNPDEVINYVSCHDDMCLNDKLKASSMGNIKESELIKQHKLAQTIVFTAQGIPFMLSGEELFRNKKGIHNTFQSPDSVNQIDWTYKGKYYNVFEYYKSLIKLRKEHPAFRMDKTEDVNKHLQFIEMPEKAMVGFLLKDYANGDTWKNILVIHNGNTKDVNINLPEGNWIIIANNGVLNIDGIGNSVSGEINVGSTSSLIAYQI